MSDDRPAIDAGRAPRPVLFGEVLFDRFPDGSAVLGGAPFNVAWHLQGFGLAPLLVSRVGEDEAGERVRTAMREWGMDTSALQADPEHPTGAVEVTLQQGQPRFHILPAQAYDHVAEAPVRAALAGVRAALLYHGTLVLRGAASRALLEALRGLLRAPVFVDVNLRDPWWRHEDLPPLLSRARWAKVNEDELGRIAAGGPAQGSLEARGRALLAARGLELLVVTRGGEGAVAFDAGGGVHAVRPRGDVAVMDTVGAGDAFCAVLLLGLLHGWPVPISMHRAQEFASRICGIRGATTGDRALYAGLAQRWG